VATTVAALLGQIYPMVQEKDATFPSGLWSVTTELIPYINRTMEDFVLKTGILKKIGSVTSQANLRLFSDPSDSMGVDRIAYDKTVLYGTSRHMIDRRDPGWRTQTGRPRFYHRDHLETGKFELDRALTVKYAALSNFHLVHTLLITPVSTTTENLPVPDYTVTYIKYGVLERMLSKEGEGQDLARARYCRNRYVFGVNLFRRLMGASEIVERSEAAA
jgi:hypothetical protein